MTQDTREQPVREEPKVRADLRDAGAALPGGFDPAFFKDLAQTEEQHFWHVTRLRIITSLVRQIVAGFPPGYQVLEVGCGTGNVTRMLEHECHGGSVTGIDIHGDALAYARLRSHCLLMQGDILKKVFDTRFHLIGLFDVLEHVECETPLLQRLHGLLADGGALLLTVPAFTSLWSYFDEASHHCRRYSAGGLRNRLTDDGFRVEFLTPYMATLFPILWTARGLRGLMRSGRRSRRSAKDLARSELRVIPVVNALLKAAVSWERRVIERRGRLPFGTSLLALARRD